MECLCTAEDMTWQKKKNKNKSIERYFQSMNINKSFSQEYLSVHSFIYKRQEYWFNTFGILLLLWYSHSHIAVR